jgi:short-subunit dehydrogenase
MKKNIVIIWSSGTLWTYFVKKMSESENNLVIEFSSKPWISAYFDPSIQSESEIIKSFNNWIGDIDRIDELHYFSGISDREFTSFPDISAMEAIKIININLIWLHIIAQNFGHKLRWWVLFAYSSIRADHPGRSLLYAASKAALNTYIRGFSKNLSEHWIISVLLILGPIHSKALNFMWSNELSSFMSSTISGKFGTPQELFDIVSNITKTESINGMEIKLFPIK